MSSETKTGKVRNRGWVAWGKGAKKSAKFKRSARQAAKRGVVIAAAAALSGCGYHLCADDYSADYKATHDVTKLDACLAIQGAQCELESRKPPVVLAPVDKPAAVAPVQ